MGCIFDNPIPYGDANDRNGSTAGAAIYGMGVACALPIFLLGSGVGIHGVGLGLALHLYYCQRNKRMKHPLRMVFAVGAFGACFSWAGPGPAQTITVPGGAMNQSPQNSQPGQVQLPIPTGGIPGNIITPETTPGLASRPQISSPGILFGSAGSGLPGMPGGPLIKAPMGAQDPSTSYMRPPVIGPLFCDPSINIAC